MFLLVCNRNVVTTNIWKVFEMMRRASTFPPEKALVYQIPIYRSIIFVGAGHCPARKAIAISKVSGGAMPLPYERLVR